MLTIYWDINGTGDNSKARVVTSVRLSTIITKLFHFTIVMPNQNDR